MNCAQCHLSSAVPTALRKHSANVHARGNVPHCNALHCQNECLSVFFGCFGASSSYYFEWAILTNGLPYLHEIQWWRRALWCLLNACGCKLHSNALIQYRSNCKALQHIARQHTVMCCILKNGTYPFFWTFGCTTSLLIGIGCLSAMLVNAQKTLCNAPGCRGLNGL